MIQFVAPIAYLGLAGLASTQILQIEFGNDLEVMQVRQTELGLLVLTGNKEYCKLYKLDKTNRKTLIAQFEGSAYWILGTQKGQIFVLCKDKINDHGIVKFIKSQRGPELSIFQNVTVSSYDRRATVAFSGNTQVIEDFTESDFDAYKDQFILTSYWQSWNKCLLRKIDITTAKSDIVELKFSNMGPEKYMGNMEVRLSGPEHAILYAICNKRSLDKLALPRVGPQHVDSGLVLGAANLKSGAFEPLVRFPSSDVDRHSDPSTNKFDCFNGKLFIVFDDRLYYFPLPAKFKST